MLQAMICILAVIAIILLILLTRNTVVPKYIKLSGFILAVISGFMPCYTITVMGESMDVNIIDLIRGISFVTGYGYDMNIKSNLFYIALFAVPLIGIAITLIRDNKVINIVTALLSFTGVIMGAMLLFKQIEIGNILKLSINIGIVVMLLAYGAALAISIIKIYAHINIDNDAPIEPMQLNRENIEDYFQDSVKIVCKNCGQENIPGCNYCKKCGERL